MKKKNLTSVLLVGLMITGFFDSLVVYGQESKNLILVDNELTKSDSIRFEKYDSRFELPDTSMSLFGKGSTWKTWRKLHKECMKAEWLRNPYYFGVSNTINLGAIVDKNYDLQRTMDSTSGFKNSEINKIINYGNFTDCGYYQEMTMSLNVFFQSEFNFTQTGSSDLNLELQSAISKSTKAKIKVDNWRINNIREENLMDILNDAPDTDIYKKRFLQSLKKEKHYILIKVIEIKGFTSYIELERDMSAELEAKLREGVIASMGNAGVDAQFSFKDKRTIEVKSGGNFYVFGEFKKVIQVTE